MERPNLDEKLNTPCDFVAPIVARGVHKDLMTPSYFTASTQPTSIAVSGAVKGPGTSPPTWGTSLTPSIKAPTMDPWLAINQAKQEILELRNENQRILMLQGDGLRRGNSTDGCTDSRARSAERIEMSQWEAERRLDVERQRAEAERLRGQVEALKEAGGRHREEIRDKEIILNRQNLEMETMREDLCRTKTELSLISVELTLKKQEKERVSSQLERLERESGEEMERLRREVERSRLEARRLATEAEATNVQAGVEANEHVLKLRQQLVELRKGHEVELQRLTSTHDTELVSVQQTSSDLLARLGLMTREMTQLKSGLLEVSSERDGLKEHLSQMENNFEAQSATLQSLRNYIGGLSPVTGEEEKLTETIQKLEREKEALQVTTELLTVRLNSVNDILALQEGEMMEKGGPETLLKGSSKGTRVLRRWREKVFTLLVQLRAKDLEMRGDKDQLRSTISSLERQVKEEKYQSSVFQHSLQDRAAELHLEKVAREAVEQDMAGTRKENAELKTWRQEAETGLRTMTEAVQRFSLAFEAKVGEVETVQTRLNGFSQRLTFAKRRVDTIQGLMLRREALRRVQHQAAKPADVSESNRLRDLQAELVLVCEERDKLTLELKRSPDLIENALAELRGQFESEVTQLSEAMEQGRLEAREATAGREDAQQRLLEARTQLEESEDRLEQLSARLLGQREDSDRALSEAEERCAGQLREMEAQLNTARREHTKAVVALRQFERHAQREREQEREAQRLQSQHTDREMRELQKRLQEKDRDRNLLLATVRERGLLNEYKQARSRARLTSAALGDQGRPSGTSSHSGVGSKDKPPAKGALLAVLGDLQALSTSLGHSSEDSSEEEDHRRGCGGPDGDA